MSQEKVDKYKESKTNRKKIMKKEKIKNIFRKCALGVVGLALVGWLGFSAYNTYESKQPRETVEIDYGSVEDYMNGLTN